MSDKQEGDEEGEGVLKEQSFEKVPLLFCSVAGDDGRNYIRNVTRETKRRRIVPTELRKNRLYYQIYCIGLNTFFASIFPVASLLFLNISTVLALRKMAQQQDLVGQVTGQNTRVILQNGDHEANQNEGNVFIKHQVRGRESANILR